jgi:DNA-binding CsgD family transcriptional regulator
VALVRNEGQPDFNRRETAFVARLCPQIALGLRLALLREAAIAETNPTPGLIVLRDDLTLDSLTPAAADWLEQIPSDLGTGLELPAAVYAAARRAGTDTDGRGERPSVARIRLRSGRWLLVHAAPLESDTTTERRTAVLLAPAAPVEITPLRLELHGLSGREREVTRLLVRGLSTDEIAATLHVTRHTVKDHTKAVYTKLGVTSRHELTAKLFDEHCVPTLDSNRTREFTPDPAETPVHHALASEQD